MAGPLDGRRWGSGGPFASSASRAPSTAMRGDRGAGAGGARCASGLGGAQDRALPGARGHRAAGLLDGACDPAPARPHRAAGGRPRPCQRFEKPAPNLLWQMDFKGWVRLGDGSRCHPLTVVDDHSRYALCLQACADQQGADGADAAETTFRRYGLPEAFFVDNGAPWGDPSGQRWTRFGGVAAQARHRRCCTAGPTIRRAAARTSASIARSKAEVFALRRLRDLAEAQRAFDAWRSVYNLRATARGARPGGAGQPLPAEPRPMPDRLPEPEYDSDEIVRTCLHHQSLHQLQGPAVESAAGILRRTRRHPAARRPTATTASSSPPTKSPRSIFASQALLTAENGLDRLDAPS